MSSSGAIPDCEYLIHESHALIHNLFTLPLTADRHFCSIFKHKIFARCGIGISADGSPGYVFSADGALLRVAWGNAPGLEIAYGTSAESATQRSNESRLQR